MLTMQGGDPLVGGLPIIHITYQQYIANPSAYHAPDVIVHISGFPTAGNLPADYVGYDNDLNMEDIGNIATKAIAKVEPSDTALYLHEVGTGFINKDGDYCITDVQISVGGTITLGTNCHVVDDGISSNLSAHNFGTTVNILTNPSSNYTCPSDGYASISCGDGDNYVILNCNNVRILTATGVKNQIQSTYAFLSVFVKKGMVLKADTNDYTNIHNTAVFVPIVN